MNFRKNVISLIERLTESRIYRFKYLPRGIDVFNDIKFQIRNINLNTIFDIGANIGQSTRIFRENFPKSRIFCFEPVSMNYKKLYELSKNDSDISSFQLAFSNRCGLGKICIHECSAMCYLLDLKASNLSDNSSISEEVEIMTIDRFCSENSISKINFLKIDTEGSDLNVLKGSEKMLENHDIDLIQVEAGMNPKNNWHVRFEDLKVFLEKYDYLLFGIYDQIKEGESNTHHLRRTNPVFISESATMMNQ